MRDADGGLWDVPSRRRHLLRCWHASGEYLSSRKPNCAILNMLGHWEAILALIFLSSGHLAFRLSAPIA